MQQRSLVLETVDRPFSSRLMHPDVGNLVAPARCERDVVLEADELVTPTGQGVVLHVAHLRLDDSFGFGIAPLAGDRLQAVATAQGQELRMKTGGAARAIDHGGFQVVDDDGTGTATKELQGMHQVAIEFRLALGQGERDETQPAVAEHGHEDRDLAGGVSDEDAAALTPVDLHGLGRLVVDFLIDAPAWGTDGPQVAADRDHAAGVAIGAASDFLVDAHRRELGILGQQGVDLGAMRIQETGSMRDLARGRLIQLERSSDRAPGTVKSPGNHPGGEFLDLGEAANLGPQTHFHGWLLSWSLCVDAMARRRISPSGISPPPGSDLRRWQRGGKERTWVNGGS